ncbi:uncharacterized protein LOC142784705 [Rhipicephalus microplus]|uniref:uncharacterized protein LOC142784705 n=1 Tax=Rhipicephalus microplus TaxID=6941 RepID=UPI003F6C076A
MEVSLDSCPGNQSSIASAVNNTFVLTPNPREKPFILFHLSYLWASFFAIFATLIIGVAVSAATGEVKKEKWQRNLCHDSAFNFWRSILPARHEINLPAWNAYLADVDHHEKELIGETLLTQTTKF